jgi:hypothetical protein
MADESKLNSLSGSGGAASDGGFEVGKKYTLEQERAQMAAFYGAIDGDLESLYEEGLSLPTSAPKYREKVAAFAARNAMDTAGKRMLIRVAYVLSVQGYSSATVRDLEIEAGEAQYNLGEYFTQVGLRVTGASRVSSKVDGDLSIRELIRALAPQVRTLLGRTGDKGFMARKYSNDAGCPPDLLFIGSEFAVRSSGEGAKLAKWHDNAYAAKYEDWENTPDAQQGEEPFNSAEKVRRILRARGYDV